jgi:hypothetical protein
VPRTSVEMEAWPVHFIAVKKGTSCMHGFKIKVGRTSTVRTRLEHTVQTSEKRHDASKTDVVSLSHPSFWRSVTISNIPVTLPRE